MGEHKDIQIVETNDHSQSGSSGSIEYDEEYYDDEEYEEEYEDDDEYDEQYEDEEEEEEEEYVEDEEDEEEYYENDNVGYRMKSSPLSPGSTVDMNVDYMNKAPSSALVAANHSGKKYKYQSA